MRVACRKGLVSTLVPTGRPENMKRGLRTIGLPLHSDTLFLPMDNIDLICRRRVYTCLPRRRRLKMNRPLQWMLVASGIFITTSSYPAISQTRSWLCILEGVTGVSFNTQNRQWRTTHFSNRTRYLIRPPTSEDRQIFSNPSVEFVAIEFGTQIPDAPCLTSGRAPNRRIYCDGGLSRFIFSPDTLRFLMFYEAGFVNAQPGKENDNTPAVGFGFCSPL